MSHDLEKFEEDLKRTYTCEVELVPCPEVQEILDYCNFTLRDIHNFLKGPYTLGTKDSFTKGYFAYQNSIMTLKSVTRWSGNKMYYIQFMDGPPEPMIPYVLIFAQFNKDFYLNLFKRLERLKAFL
jgi:hypothetical protein